MSNKANYTLTYIVQFDSEHIKNSLLVHLKSALTLNDYYIFMANTASLASVADKVTVDQQ